MGAWKANWGEKKIRLFSTFYFFISKMEIGLAEEQEIVPVYGTGDMASYSLESFF